MILDYMKRPVEVFSAANKEHRKHYATFLKTNTWGTCPIRFEIQGSDASNNNASYAMQRLIAEHYIQQEFQGMK